MTEYERWLSVELDDPDLKEELLSVKDQPEEINDRFYRDLAFGTGGLRRCHWRRHESHERLHGAQGDTGPCKLPE